MNNNKRRIVLAVVGVGIMVILLVGSSYAALFNYENVSLPDVKTNSKIVFSLEGDKDIVIHNKMPITKDTIDNENMSLMKISIIGHNNFKEGANYRIFFVKGDDEIDNLIDDSVVYAQITYPSVAPGYAVNDYGVNDNKSFGQEYGAPLTGLNSGKELKLIEGNIHTLAEDAKQDFVIKIWLDSSKVIVSDIIERDNNNHAINCNSNDLGKLVYRTEEFNELKMSIKLKVENN